MLATLAPAAVPTREAQTKLEMAALKGVKAVFTGQVLISDQTANDPAAPDASNLDDLFQTKLTESNIKLVDSDSLTPDSKSYAIPHVTMNISVTILKPINGLVGYIVKVEAYEDATVVRTEKLMAATVWERSMMAVVERKSLAESISTDLDSALDDFIKTYRAANAKG